MMSAVRLRSERAKALNEFTFMRFGYRLENIGIQNVDEDFQRRFARRKARAQEQISQALPTTLATRCF